MKEKELKHIILEDLKALFNAQREDSFMNSLLNKLNVKKHQFLKEVQNIDKEVEALKYRKLEYVDCTLKMSFPKKN